MDTEMNETLVLDDKALPAEGATQAPSTIIEKVEQFVRRFVFFKDDSLYRLVALWIVATHLHSAFEYTGYLFAYSARPQSGKSRLLEVLDLLVLNSSGILISPTEAVLFHTASGGTQLLDEVDSWSERDTLRSVLNAGFRRGNTVPRMSKTETEGYDLKRFLFMVPGRLRELARKSCPRPLGTAPSCWRCCLRSLRNAGSSSGLGRYNRLRMHFVARLRSGRRVIVGKL